jgi:hypothetical protein
MHALILCLAIPLNDFCILFSLSLDRHWDGITCNHSSFCLYFRIKHGPALALGFVPVMLRVQVKVLLANVLVGDVVFFKRKVEVIVIASRFESHVVLSRETQGRKERFVHMVSPRQCSYFRLVVMKQRCSERIGHRALSHGGLFFLVFELDVTSVALDEAVRFSERVAQSVYPKDDTEGFAICALSSNFKPVQLRSISFRPSWCKEDLLYSSTAQVVD